MDRLQAFKYELMPNGEQERDMRRFAGSARFVFNKALAMQKARYEQGEKKLGYFEICKSLTEWRNDPETVWLSEAPVHTLQQSLKDLDRSYTNFFAKRADFPRFKKRGQSDSFRYPDPKQIKLDQGNNRIFLPKLGWLRYRNSRNVLGSVRNVTISRSNGKWFASIQTQRQVEQPQAIESAPIGINMGVTQFVAFNDGSFVAPLNSFKKHQQRLAKYQRRMARKIKFSSNWKKAKAGTGLFFIFEPGVALMPLAIAFTLIGLAAIGYSVYTHHRPLVKAKLPIWAALLVVTWLGLGYDYYDRHATKAIPRGEHAMPVTKARTTEEWTATNLEIISNQTFTDEEILLDGRNYLSCDFHHVIFVYNGTAPSLMTSSTVDNESRQHLRTDNPALVAWTAMLKSTGALKDDWPITLGTHHPPSN